MLPSLLAKAHSWQSRSGVCVPLAPAISHKLSTHNNWTPLVVRLPVVLQRRLGVWAYSLIVVASVIFWFAGLGDCSRSAFQYQGLPVTEVSNCNLWVRLVEVLCNVTAQADLSLVAACAAQADSVSGSSYGNHGQ